MIYDLDGYRPCLADSVWVAPNAQVIGNVVLNEYSSVWFGALIRGDHPESFEIGAYSNVQDNAIIHSDAGVKLRIGNYVTVGHAATIHGATVGDNTLIGMNAVILNRAVIGQNCLVGAGALITEGKTFPDGVLILGSPARVVRELSTQEIANNRASAERYIKNAQYFKEHLKLVK